MFPHHHPSSNCSHEPPLLNTARAPQSPHPTITVSPSTTQVWRHHTQPWFHHMITTPHTGTRGHHTGGGEGKGIGCAFPSPTLLRNPQETAGATRPPARHVNSRCRRRRNAAHLHGALRRALHSSRTPRVSRSPYASFKTEGGDGGLHSESTAWSASGQRDPALAARGGGQ